MSTRINFAIKLPHKLGNKEILENLLTIFWKLTMI